MDRLLKPEDFKLGGASTVITEDVEDVKDVEDVEDIEEEEEEEEEKAKLSDGMARILATPENEPVLRVFVGTTLAMGVLPLGVFWMVRNVVVPFLLPQAGSESEMLYAGISAVVTVNLVIAAYAVYAYNEVDERMEGPHRKAE